MNQYNFIIYYYIRFKMSKPYFAVGKQGYSNARPQKITQRAIRSGEYNPNQENSVKEFQAFEQQTKIKREAFEQLEKETLTRMYGTPEEKAALARQYHDQLKENEYTRLAQQDAERAETARIERDMIERIKY